MFFCCRAFLTHYSLDKVTKLRKPTAVPHLATRPHTIHVAKPTHPLDSQAPAPAHNPRLFKHSISLDVPVSHRPPLRNAATNQPLPTLLPIAKSASTATRFAEIRPRYLEPKVRLSTQSVDNLMRTSNQALNKRASMKSINSLGLSRDSLATASSHKTTTGAATSASATARPKQYRSQTIMSQDSLNSRRSAQQQPQQQPCRSMSRDSLAKSNSMSRLRRPYAPTNVAGGSSTATSKSDDVISPATSNATTTRSSRLSSGYLSSPRDSNATSAGARKSAALAAIVAVATGTSPRKSFISAKSREILAKRASALNRADSLRVGPSTSSSSNVAALAQPRIVAGGALNKSSSTSNIPTSASRMRLVSAVAPTPLQTTLHLRRTARMPAADTPNRTASVSALAAPAGRYVGMAKKAAQTASNMQIKKDMMLERGAKATVAKPTDDHWTEPRMERSMTFCKDSSDLDASTLTIVE